MALTHGLDDGLDCQSILFTDQCESRGYASISAKDPAEVEFDCCTEDK